MPAIRRHASRPRSVPLLLLALLIAAALLVSGCSDAGSGEGDRGFSAGSSDDRAAAPAEPDAGGGAQKDAGDQAQQPAQAPTQASAGAGEREGGGTADAQRPPKPAPSHVIRTASLDIRAKHLDDAVEDARRLAEEAGGYVGSETTRRDPDQREHSRMVLRIPPDTYEDTLDDLAGLGKVLERDTSARDVTDEVVDLESRIKTQRASVDRVRKLMDRAEHISDVVTLEGELRTRQADLESLLAQAKSLASRTGMATVTLTLTGPEPKEEREDDGGVGSAVLDALADGWHAFYVAVRALLIGAAAVLPFAAALALVYVAVRRFLSRRLPRALAGPLPTPTPTHMPVPMPVPVATPATASTSGPAATPTPTPTPATASAPASAPANAPASDAPTSPAAQSEEGADAEDKPATGDSTG